MTLCATGVDFPTAVVDAALALRCSARRTSSRSGPARRTTDTDATLRFVGRVDDVIKVAGENVSLTEVAAVAEAPGGVEAAVIACGVPEKSRMRVTSGVRLAPTLGHDHRCVAADCRT
jgi:crotonobetaine/carnitine-CoA ligase